MNYYALPLRRADVVAADPPQGRGRVKNASLLVEPVPQFTVCGCHQNAEHSNGKEKRRDGNEQAEYFDSYLGNEIRL